MNRRAQVLFVCLGLLAAALLYVLPLEDLFALDTHNLIGLGFFVAVGVLSEAMAIDFGTGRQASSSLAFLPFLASAVLFSPGVAVPAVALVVAFSSLVLSRQGVFLAVFNISQAALTVAVGSLAYGLLLDAGSLSAAIRPDVNYVGYAVLAFVFFTSNILLSSLAISVLRTQNFNSVLRQVIGPRGGNLWYDLLASPIALVPVALYKDYYVTGILIILLPLLVIRSSYLSKLQLEEANRDLLKVLVKAIETRDPYTSGHSVRVSTLARLIAKDLELPLRRQEQIETAALLHDIGKIDAVYSAVIRKPYDLNDDERNLIRTHATKGADLLQNLSSVSAEVIKAVRHHHERYDGTGYPAGLRGDEIPLAARIIMLCDSIDAMLSDRPYRHALSVAKVRSELVRCAGTQFDPNVVQVVLRRNTLERAASLVKRSEPSDPEIVALTASG